MLKLWHISVYSPEELDGKLMPHRNTTITGEDVCAVFAEEASEGNPYLARDSRAGMYCFKDIVVYNSENIHHEDGKLLLNRPTYIYDLPTEGFEKVVNGDTKEYILRDKEIAVSDCDVTKVEDVTSLCNNKQLFSSRDGKHIGKTLYQLAMTNKEDAFDYLHEQIDNGNLVYHNEYVGINVNPMYCKNAEKENGEPSDQLGNTLNQRELSARHFEEVSQLFSVDDNTLDQFDI